MKPMPASPDARHLTLRQAYQITATHTPQSLNMQFQGLPVYEIAAYTNHFYRVMFTDMTAQTMFSPPSERPITITRPCRKLRPPCRPQ